MSPSTNIVVVRVIITMTMTTVILVEIVVVLPHITIVPSGEEDGEEASGDEDIM